MAHDTMTGPIKTREFQNHHFDSKVWNDFAFRDNDIIIGTYAKSGTTWTQQIVSQLIFNGETDLPVADMSPWLDMRIYQDEKIAALEAQTHRRFIKTHLPSDAIVFSPKAKYLYIGRDGRDVVWSLYNHHANGNDLMFDALNNTPGRVGPEFPRLAGTEVEYFREWLANDGYPYWAFWEHIKSWWDIRETPNVLLVHFEKMKEDMGREIRRIAEFLEIKIDESKWEDILLHCSFDYMKAHAPKTVPLQGAMWEGGISTFINKGTNGRWRDLLTAEDVARYERASVDNLGENCARWLATGEGVD